MKRATKALPLILAAAWVTPAFAGGRYDGPAVDVNFINQKPAKYAECDKYLNDASARRFAACEFGRDEAERMADRFGGGNGRVQGYLRGFSWSLNKMTKLTSNDAAELLAGEHMIDSLGQYMQAGIQAGQAAGRNDGSSRGRGDAIERFTSVVDKNRDPDATLRVPPTNYQGEDGAYEKYVGPIPTAQSIMQKDLNLGMLKVYDSWDATYLGEKQPLSMWDLWFDNGTYVFEKARWFDQNLAMQTWLQRPIDTKPKYDNLNQGAPLDPVTQQPIDLQGVFRSAFVDSYAYYVNYYYSQQFYTNLEQGSMEGEMVGVQVGKRLAHYNGMEHAFNRKFKESSASSYRDTFTGSYTDNFNATFRDYASSPKLSLQFERVLGNPDVGILQPGQQFDAVFVVRNIGGVGSQLDASVSGNVTDTVAQTFSIKKLSSARYRAPLIGRFDPKLHPRDTARVTLNVNGIVSTLGEQVQNMVEISSPTYRLSVTEGSGEVHVQVNNIANVRTPGTIVASLLLNGRPTATQQIGFLAPGEQGDVVLAFSHLDPLALINGELSAKVIVSMNDQQMDTAEMNLTAGQHDVLLVKYFNQLINERGAVPGGISRDDRIADVQNQIVKLNEAETRNHRSGENIYRTNVSSTMVGKLVAEFKASPQSERAKAQYDGLAHILWGHQKNLRKFLFINLPKRAHYRDLVKQLASTKLK